MSLILTLVGTALGTLVFGGLWLRIFFRFDDPLDIGKKRAGKALPAVAQKLGMEYLPPERMFHYGGLGGSYRGFDVIFEPSPQVSILQIDLHGETIRAHLGIRKSVRSHVNEGMEPFDFRSKSVDSFFATRFADRGVAESLQKSQAIIEFVGAFKRSWGSKISEFSYGNGSLQVRFKHGSGSYIPADDIEPVLNDLVTLAGLLESL